jgi:hypothetical protein
MELLEKQLEVLHIFKKNMLEFLDELIEQFEEEGDLIILRFFVSEQIPIEVLMKRFTEFVYPHQKMISEKNEKFFLENNNIFGASPQDKVIHFKELYLKMPEDDRDTLWSWFRAFIGMCEKYQALK